MRSALDRKQLQLASELALEEEGGVAEFALQLKEGDNTKVHLLPQAEAGVREPGHEARQQSIWVPAVIDSINHATATGGGQLLPSVSRADFYLPLLQHAPI